MHPLAECLIVEAQRSIDDGGALRVERDGAAQDVVQRIRQAPPFAAKKSSKRSSTA